MLSLDISDINQLDHAASELIRFAGSDRIWLFDAPMGSGKTTFIKAVCTKLGVKNGLSSPTYSIVNEYEAENGQKIYHFDLYRLRDVSELYDLGFEEYLSGNAYVFIEWPELAMGFVDQFLRIIIKTDNQKRYLYAEKKTAHA